MSVNPQSWEDIKAELGRKSSDVAAALLDKLDTGSISEREMRIALDAVYDTISGLAPRDVADTIYELSRGLDL